MHQIQRQVQGLDRITIIKLKAEQLCLCPKDKHLMSSFILKYTSSAPGREINVPTRQSAHQPDVVTVRSDTIELSIKETTPGLTHKHVLGIQKEIHD